VVVAWIVFFYNIHFERHLVMLISAFASKELYYMSGQEEPNSESTNLVEGANSGSSLPGWCHVDIERYKQSRPLWRRYLVGGIPNRQEALYWMDRKGPPLYRFILQVGLLFVGVYAAFQFLHCGPIMYQTLPLGFFILYVILATLPALFIIRNKKHLIATLTPVCCLGVYRRPQVIANVIREEKTARAVRAFIVVFKLRRFAMQAACAKLKKLSIHYNDYFDKFEVSEVGQTFDEFDVDGTGTITPDEFQQVMERMGASLTHDQLSNLIQNLDKDCSGGVSREEFIQWYADHCHEDNLDEHELATFMFKAFDTDNDGEISVSEFKKRLESRTTQFTLDEVGGLVNELDENNCGKVCIEEFEHLLHKYYPKELKKSNQHSSWHHN
jgi:Ca2+-binding EF-hand superfamily protein